MHQRLASFDLDVAQLLPLATTRQKGGERQTTRSGDAEWIRTDEEEDRSLCSTTPETKQIRP
jgi:hypothetical protein